MVLPKEDLHEHPHRSTVVHPLEDVFSPQELNALTRDQQQALWHMRLNHVNHARVAKAHEFMDGIPPLPRHDMIHDCPLCKEAKLHKAARGDSEHPEQNQNLGCWDDVQIDVGFMASDMSIKNVVALQFSKAIGLVTSDMSMKKGVVT